MKAALYLRKSRAEEQDTVEETLKRHRETLLAYAKDHALEIPTGGIYEEVASGDSLYARPQMLRLLAELDRYDAVLCMDIDRLGRGAMSEQGIILETLKTAGVRIITPRKIYDLNNELDEEYTEFETFMARRELKTIKRRMQRGIRKTLEEGGYLPNAPYGYEKALDHKRPTLKINEEEAAFVRMMFELYVNQGMGCQVIADTVSALGARPRRSERFCRTSVRGILKNPVYLGKIVWNRRNEPPTVAQGLHPPIIQEQTFCRAQEILAGRYHPPYYKGTVENPLAGLVFCRECGGPMQRRPLPGGAQLLCPRKGCVTSCRLDYALGAVEGPLRQFMADLQLIPLDPESPPEAEHTAQRLAEREKKVVQRQIDRLHDLLEQGVYAIDVYRARYARLTEKLESIGSAGKLLGRREELRNAPEAARRFNNLLELYEALNAQGKNELLKALIDRVEYWKAPGGKPRQFELTILLKTL